MEILKRFQADRHVRALQSGERGDSAALVEARRQVESLGAAGAHTLLGALTYKPGTPATLDTLAALVSATTLPEFLEALRSPHDPVADAAAFALSRGGGWDPAVLLLFFTDERYSRARLEEVLDAQSASVPPARLLEMMSMLAKETRPVLWRLLDKSADESVVTDAIALSSNPDWWLRLYMTKLLSRFPSPTVNAALARLLADEHAMVRLEAVRAVARVGAREALKALCARLHDQDLKVQTAAIEALVKIGDVSAVPHLLDALKDESEFVRRGAVEVLNQVITPEAIKDLVDALRDADWWVRVRSADALGTLGGPKVVDAVLGLTKDPDEFARRYAIEILNAVPDPRAVPALIEALDDDDWWVRERAIDALGKTGATGAIDPLRRVLTRDPRSVPLCIRALAAIGTEAVIDPLLRVLASEDPGIRREAIEGLIAVSNSELSDEARSRITSALDAAGVRVSRSASRRPGDVVRKPAEPRDSGTPDRMRMHDGANSGPRPPSEIFDPSRTRVDVPRPVSAGAPPLPHDAGTAPPLDFQKLPAGTELIGRFRVIERIGSGGFGTVYRVEDLFVKEELVLKVLLPQLSLDQNMIKRFVQELRLTRRISHPNVIRIHDLIDLNGAHAISMEYFAGRDLGVVLREEGALSPARAIHIAEQVLDGLTAAHAAGVLHRDIKPANLLVGENDSVRIVDFGLASATQTNQSRLTQSGLLVGTPEYISPEQIRGTDIDARCDLYSFGVVMYEALSGRAPFQGATAVNILFQHLEGEIPRLSQVAAGIPAELDDFVMQAMAREPGNRPASTAAMLEMLRARG